MFPDTGTSSAFTEALLAGCFEIRDVSSGDILCREGSAVLEVYVIRTGLFKVRKTLIGQAMDVLTLRAGAMIGETLVLAQRNARYTYDIVCGSFTGQVFVIPRDAIEDGIRKSPPAVVELMTHIASQFDSVLYEYLPYLLDNLNTSRNPELSYLLGSSSGLSPKGRAQQPFAPPPSLSVSGLSGASEFSIPEGEQQFIRHLSFNATAGGSPKQRSKSDAFISPTHSLPVTDRLYHSETSPQDVVVTHGLVIESASSLVSPSIDPDMSSLQSSLIGSDLGGGLSNEMFATELTRRLQTVLEHHEDPNVMVRDVSADVPLDYGDVDVGFVEMSDLDSESETAPEVMIETQKPDPLTFSYDIHEEEKLIVIQMRCLQDPVTKEILRLLGIRFLTMRNSFDHIDLNDRFKVGLSPSAMATASDIGISDAPERPKLLARPRGRSRGLSVPSGASVFSRGSIDDNVSVPSPLHFSFGDRPFVEKAAPQMVGPKGIEQHPEQLLGMESSSPLPRRYSWSAPLEAFDRDFDPAELGLETEVTEQECQIRVATVLREIIEPSTIMSICPTAELTDEISDFSTDVSVEESVTPPHAKTSFSCLPPRHPPVPQFVQSSGDLGAYSGLGGCSPSRSGQDKRHSLNLKRTKSSIVGDILQSEQLNIFDDPKRFATLVAEPVLELDPDESPNAADYDFIFDHWNVNFWLFRDKQLICNILSEHLNEMCVIFDVPLSRQKIDFFVLLCSLEYSNYAYHNFRHVMEVYHACVMFIREGRMERFLSNIEIVALLISAVAHDLAHPGHNSDFELRLKNNVSTRYDLDPVDGGVLEQYHCLRTNRALHISGLFDDLPDTTSRYMRFLIKHIIMATDLKQHFTYLNVLQKLTLQKLLEQHENGYMLDLSDVDYHDFTSQSQTRLRVFLCQILIKCADVCNPAKTFALAFESAIRATHEIVIQGQMEAQFESRPSKDLDFFQVQKDFLTIIVQPLFSTLSRLFFPLSCLPKTIVSNIDNYMSFKLSLDCSEFFAVKTIWEREGLSLAGRTFKYRPSVNVRSQLKSQPSFVSPSKESACDGVIQGVAEDSEECQSEEIAFSSELSPSVPPSPLQQTEFPSNGPCVLV